MIFLSLAVCLFRPIFFFRFLIERGRPSSVAFVIIRISYSFLLLHASACPCVLLHRAGQLDTSFLDSFYPFFFSSVQYMKYICMYIQYLCNKVLYFTYTQDEMRIEGNKQTTLLDKLSQILSQSIHSFIHSFHSVCLLKTSTNGRTDE